MNVQIRKRDFSDELVLPDLDYTPQRYSHAAIGGPKLATIRVKGDDLDLWSLIERVRNPITIYAGEGDAVWWGYISQVEAVVKNAFAIPARVRVGVSVETMYNRIAIAYNLVNLTTGAEERATTAWTANANSAASYGTKEILLSRSAATAAHAEAARDMELVQRQYPIPTIEPVDDSESYAQLTCRGWWDTLEWQYYANSGTASVDTATQAGTICAAEGQFFSGVDILDASGISIRETRDGDASALYEAEQLLEMGTNNYRRLLATVDVFRRVQIYEEPAKPTAPYRLLADGSFEDGFGTPIRNTVCPVAFWARLVDAIPPSVDTSLLADPAMLFVEEMEYDVARDRLTPRPRGALDPWQFPKVRDG